MPTLYPGAIDSFQNPTTITNLSGSGNPALIHSTQHTNTNDALKAIETHVGISGSLDSTTIEFRLGNVDSGHDHDGINSKPVVIGPPTSGSLYVSGAFSFDQSTRVGEAVDQLNQLLFDTLSSSLVSFEYEGNPQGDSGTTDTVNFVGSGVTASFVGNTTTYQVFRGLLPEDRELILLADCGGPFENYPNSYNETLMHRNVFPSASIWYSDVGKTSKIIEQELVYQGNSIVPTQSIYRTFEQDGVSVRTTSIDTIFYNGIFEISRSRSII